MRTTPAARLPRSGNAALAAGALIQAALGAEFLLAGLSKFADAEFTTQFKGFVEGSPGAKSGVLAQLIQTLVVPNISLAADLAKFTEAGAGVFLLVAALEVARRRFSGPFGTRHTYESAVALLSAAAAVAVGGLSLMIYLIEGGGVPLAFGIAWLEFGRFRALRR